jgi:hypothetical protein
MECWHTFVGYPASTAAMCLRLSDTFGLVDGEWPLSKTFVLTPCLCQCNREWPCDACQARRVAHKCRFAPPKTTADKSTPALNKKRSRTFEAEDHTAPLVANDDSDSDDSLDLEAIGYGGSLLSSLVGVHIQVDLDPTDDVPAWDSLILVSVCRRQRPPFRKWTG